MRLSTVTLLLCTLLLAPIGCGDDLEQVSDQPAPGPHTGPKPGPAVVPPVAPAGGPGELVVYWQPTGMGDVDMNLTRWIGSVLKPDGTPATRDDAVVAKREINGLEVTTLDITGDLGAGQMGSAHAAGATKGRRLLCAIASVPGGVPYYIKASGSVKTMEAAQVHWEAFLTSMKIDAEGKLAFQLPAGWKGSKPTSTMRYAQATIPGAGD